MGARILQQNQWLPNAASARGGVGAIPDKSRAGQRVGLAIAGIRPAGTFWPGWDDFPTDPADYPVCG